MENNSFWISLLVFCLLMCSCKSKEVAHDINVATKENVRTNYTEYQALSDTSNVLKIEIDKSKLTITEHITITKYDKDTGAITETTEAKRKITQDSDKVVAEEGNQSVTDCNGLEVEHIADVSKKMDAEVKEESIGGQEAFGKWFGIVIGIAVSILSVYLLRKFRVN